MYQEYMNRIRMKTWEKNTNKAALKGPAEYWYFALQRQIRNRSHSCRFSFLCWSLDHSPSNPIWFDSQTAS